MRAKEEKDWTKTKLRLRRENAKSCSSMSGIWGFNFKGLRWLCTSSFAGCSYSFSLGLGPCPVSSPSQQMSAICGFLSQPSQLHEMPSQPPHRAPNSATCWLALSDLWTVEKEPHLASFMSSQVAPHGGHCRVLTAVQDRAWPPWTTAEAASIYWCKWRFFGFHLLGAGKASGSPPSPAGAMAGSSLALKALFLGFQCRMGSFSLMVML